ncbi:type II secretion system F family protein [Urbifossiella limnaea]|uniref:General secretion pathway protein F n=1 Tax=Urbifossiella limnaea TaxID=2528023 RepID=A0A517XL11_9BACT|nr:type II secretion system F family protein [Urbifossiella limnaea]QDU18197.1 Type II secretion system protein F [Urbifossiella limnaea]
MPDFTYDALNRTGSKTTGTIAANTEREAAMALDAKGLFPTRIALARTQAATGGFFSRVSARNLATFYSQLADLLQTGVPLLRSLELLERQSTNPKLQAVVREVRGKVADGTGLAQAMAQHPSVFDELAVSMVKAGQEGGFLEDVLKRISVFVEHQEDIKAKVVGALAYPAFLALAGFLVLNILVIFFVPKFAPVFEKLKEKDDLPGLTMALMAFSDFLRSWQGFVVGVLAVVGFVAFVRWTRGNGRVWADRVRIRLPLFGKVFLALALSRFTRILGTMLHNGIPILRALTIAKDSTGNRVLTAAIEKSAENVTAGEKLADPLRKSGYFPPDVVEMIAIGEEANTLERVLIDISDSLEKRTARQLELMVKLLEPIMLLVMAGVTLLVVAGLLLPVFKMGQTVGG